MYFVYIVSCVGDMLYTGITTDPDRRFREHRGEVSGGAKFTRAHRPEKVAGLWALPDRSSALKLEAKIKKLTRAEKLSLIRAPESVYSLSADAEPLALSEKGDICSKH